MTGQSLQSVANRLVEYCRQNDTATGLRELYAPDAVSVEASIMPGSDSAETVGIDAIKAKHDWWNEAFEVHSAEVEGPFLHGEDRFGVIFEFDATNKSTGERNAMRELGIYTLKNGRIVREEFFYNM